MKLGPYQAKVKEIGESRGFVLQPSHTPWSSDDRAYWTACLELVRDRYRTWDTAWSGVVVKLKGRGRVEQADLLPVLFAGIRLKTALLLVFVCFEGDVDGPVFFSKFSAGKTLRFNDDVRSRNVLVMQNQVKSFYSSLAGEWRRFIRCHRSEVECPNTDVLNSTALTLKALLEWFYSLEVDSCNLLDKYLADQDFLAFANEASSLTIPAIKKG